MILSYNWYCAQFVHCKFYKRGNKSPLSVFNIKLDLGLKELVFVAHTFTFCVHRCSDKKETPKGQNYLHGTGIEITSCEGETIRYAIWEGIIKESQKKGKVEAQRKRRSWLKHWKWKEDKETADRKDESERWRADAHKEWKSEQLLFRISHSVIWTTKNTLHKTAGIRKEEPSCFRIKKCVYMWGHFIALLTKIDCFPFFCGATDIFFGRGGWQKERHKWREKVRNKKWSLRQTNKETNKEPDWHRHRGSDWHASPPTSQQTSL